MWVERPATAELAALPTVEAAIEAAPAAREDWLMTWLLEWSGMRGTRVRRVGTRRTRAGARHMIHA